MWADGEVESQSQPSSPQGWPDRERRPVGGALPQACKEPASAGMRDPGLAWSSPGGADPEASSVAGVFNQITAFLLRDV